jgi:mono/diheme cytochrome c family protein
VNHYPETTRKGSEKTINQHTKMKRPFAMVALIAAILTSACKPESKDQTSKEAEDFYEIPTAPAVPTQAELIERGKYLVITSACHDCHSPKIMTENGPVPDPARLMSGHPKDEQLPPADQNAGRNGWILFSPGLTGFIGPWGTSYSANLTPDDTGIGAWTFENFKTAIRKGKYKGQEGGRNLLPPMPWDMYKNMTDDDLKAIFTYLKSLPKVNNLVPSPKPPAES